MRHFSLVDEPTQTNSSTGGGTRFIHLSGGGLQPINDGNNKSTPKQLAGRWRALDSFVASEKLRFHSSSARAQTSRHHDDTTTTTTSATGSVCAHHCCRRRRRVTTSPRLDRRSLSGPASRAPPTVGPCSSRNRVSVACRVSAGVVAARVIGCLNIRTCVFQRACVRACTNVEHDARVAGEWCVVYCVRVRACVYVCVCVYELC